MTTGIVRSPDAAPVERELATAGDLQRKLLPPSPFTHKGWSAAHRFEPGGTVSGDYVDLLPADDRLYFMLGDVSGKGIAASLLMAQLHAMFRSLIPFGHPLEELLARASALVCASSLPSQYATLVVGYVEPDGRVLIANAGHPAPMAMTRRGYIEVRATGVPVGMFCHSQFTTTALTLAPGDTLLMFTDGLTEANNEAGVEYGPDRVRHTFGEVAHLPLQGVLDHVLAIQEKFRDGRPNLDDVTLLAIRPNEVMQMVTAAGIQAEAASCRLP